MIGIDSVAQKLLVVQNHEEIKIHHFDLKTVKQTELILINNSIVKNGKTEEILQGVEIAFSFYTKDEKEILNLYDYDLNTYQDFEVKNAGKLHKHLQELILAQTVIKRTA